MTRRREGRRRRPWQLACGDARLAFSVNPRCALGIGIGTASNKQGLPCVGVRGRWREWFGPSMALTLAARGPSPSAMSATASCLRSEPALARQGSASAPPPKSKRATRWVALLLFWWRRRELNPRPKALGARHYMLITLFDLVLRQHNVRGAPPDQPLSFSYRPKGAGIKRSRDNDPTSTSTGTSGFGARP